MRVSIVFLRYFDAGSEVVHELNLRRAHLARILKMTILNHYRVKKLLRMDWVAGVRPP